MLFDGLTALYRERTRSSHQLSKYEITPLGDLSCNAHRPHRTVMSHPEQAAGKRRTAVKADSGLVHVVELVRGASR